MVCRVGGRLRLDSCSSIPPDRAKEKIQWYFRKSFIIFAVCSVEPLALPLIVVASTNNAGMEDRTHHFAQWKNRTDAEL